MNQISDSLTSSKDTLVIYDVPPELLRSYMEILENTNNQLSLASNPMTWFIAALGILFTVGAIVTGFFLFRQGKDFKERQDEIINTSRERMEELHLKNEKLYEDNISILTDIQKKVNIDPKSFDFEYSQTLQKRIESDILNLMERKQKAKIYAQLNGILKK